MQKHLLHLAVIPCKAALRSLFIERRQVLPSFFHSFYDLVERHAVVAVGKSGVDVGVEGTGSGVGIALDTWNLDKTAYRVAGHAQVVFKRHLCSVFNLGRTSPKQLIGGSGGHGTCHTHLALTTYLSTRDGGVGAHDVAYQACRHQGTDNAWSVKS